MLVVAWVAVLLLMGCETTIKGADGVACPSGERYEGAVSGQTDAATGYWRIRTPSGANVVMLFDSGCLPYRKAE